MMEEYVNKEKVLELLCEKCPEQCIVICCPTYLRIHQLPAADVTPVVRGEWKQTGNHSAVCTACGKTTFVAGVDRTGKALIHKGLFHFCPNCGADMRKEANDDGNL